MRLMAGELELPFQRPIEECRTFKSTQVEKVISDVTKQLADKDLARLFENCFPNTLDTTIRWHTADTDYPQTFIITGDM
jgi:meiotically up-regulated gene 157 (Mug157) protein